MVIGYEVEEGEEVLLALARAVEQRDSLTCAHCERLSLFSLSLGVLMGLPRHQLAALHRGGYLHDIGKVAMPDAILLKSGPLDDREWAAMKTHTIKGEQICRPMKSLQPVLPIIRSHHEKWDGSGYPDGLRGQEIPLLARILQLADIYDALISVRPYKPALSSEQALGIMAAETDRGWRDPELMGLFRQLHHAALARATEPERGMSLGNLRQRLEDAMGAALPFSYARAS